MNEPEIIIRLDENGRTYSPGATLSGEYRIEAVNARSCRPSRSRSSGIARARATRTWTFTNSGGKTPIPAIWAIHVVPTVSARRCREVP